MIGQDNDEEEVHFKVADRRKFNSDGSVRAGVTLEAALEPAKVEVPPQEPAAAVKAPEAEQDLHAEADAADEDFAGEQQAHDEAGDDDSDIPGADDPASFVNFLSTLATNAAAALGAIPHPATGQRVLDLESGKYWLDILAMLRDKTKANLHPKEARLLEGLLADLRLQYVQLVRATEEKLKAQSAQKFSGADILGQK